MTMKKSGIGFWGAFACNHTCAMTYSKLCVRERQMQLITSFLIKTCESTFDTDKYAKVVWHGYIISSPTHSKINNWEDAKCIFHNIE